MTRPIRLLALALLAGLPIAGSGALVNTRLHPTEILASEDTLQLDLRDYFQNFDGTGPVATFSLYMPVQDGLRALQVATKTDPATGATIPDTTEGGPTLEMMTYQLAAGGTYTHAFGVHPAEFNWSEGSVQFQLLPAEAPVAVANFMTYVNDGAYANTIVHRSEINVLQAGGWALSATEGRVLDLIETLAPIAFEQTRNNTAGTLAMDRQSTFNSATSQFRINLADNTGSFGSAYTVFGELTGTETALPLLQQMGDATTYNLTRYISSAPLLTTPLYTPFWDDQGSYVRFPAVTVTAGNPDGVTYSWEWVDADGVEGVSEQEAANRAVFAVGIEGSSLSVSRSDTGTASIKVTGTSGGQSASFQINMAAYNPEALDVFPSSSISQGGWIENSWFGSLQADDFPHIVHANHGPQYVYRHFYRVTDSSSYVTEFYLYDHNLDSWLYTTSSRYPILYIFSTGQWVTYQKTTGNGSDIPRWFWDYATKAWFSE